MSAHSWITIGLVAMMTGCIMTGESQELSIDPDEEGDDGLVHKTLPTTVFLVRHAEKASIPGDSDPPLSAQGQQRAQDLAWTLRHVRLDGAIASTFQRTIQTAAPSAADNGISVTSFPPGDTSQMASHIMQNWAGGDVLVAGHTTTVGQVAVALGVPGPAWTIPSYDYDNLYIVDIPPGQSITPGASTLYQDKYGAPTPSPNAVNSVFSHSLSCNQARHYGPFTVEQGSDFLSQITGTGDADIYVQFGSAPGYYVYDCNPYLHGSDEICDLIVPIGETKVYVTVHTEYWASYTIDTTYVPGAGAGSIGSTLTNNWAPISCGGDD